MKLKIELFKKLEFNQLLAEIDSFEATQEQKDKVFEIESDFDHINFNDLDEATFILS